jgi:hypothetical protein
VRALRFDGTRLALADVPRPSPPPGEALVRGALLQDMAVLSEKAGDKDTAVKLAQQSVDTLSSASRLDVRVVGLDTATGIVRRAGNADLATQFAN